MSRRDGQRDATLDLRRDGPPLEFDDYRVIRPLGRGRAGLVYLARDTILERLVAIKFTSHCGERERRRFLVEARAIARVQHPNVVTVYRAGRIRELDDWPYLVQEYIRGTGLHRVPKPVSGQRAVVMGRDIARGLAAVHRRGVLHGDIKPANVMVTEDGEAKVVDFGLARLLEDGGDGERTGCADAGGKTARIADDPGFHREFLGTPYYMAPEIWRGEPATSASDVYSLAVVLYELCAGHVPHHQVRRSRLGQVVQERDARSLAGAVTGVSSRFAALVDRCLTRDPLERLSSADQLGDALDALARPEPVRLRRNGLCGRPRCRCCGRPLAMCRRGCARSSI